MKNNKGEITIPLVVIVIVIIIIGAICIFMLTGENGLFILKEYEVNQDTTNNTVNTNQVQNITSTENTTNNENVVTTLPVE